MPYNQAQKEATARWKAKKLLEDPNFFKKQMASWYEKNKEKVSKDSQLYMQSAKGLLHRAKRRAQSKGLDFDITLEDIVIPTHCPVFGMPLVFRTEVSTQHASDNAPSLDRFDNTKGYIKGNVRVISHRANSCKRNMTLEEVRQLLNYMSS